MQQIAIERVFAPGPEVYDLVNELDQTLALEYLPEQRHGLSLDAIFEPHVRFFLARLRGVAVGCGGVALFATFGEVKRMYVTQGARGVGVARALLARIESETRRSGLAVLRLETGSRQTAALRLYERSGFERCAAFGAYASMAPQAIATSVFLEKRLAPGRGDTALVG